MVAAPPPVLSQQGGVRIAVMVMAAPVICCAAGLAVLLLLKHHQAALVAGYAARHLLPWPAAQGWNGEPSSFLHGAEATREVLVRNPAQWGMDIGMVSSALVPALLIAGAATLYGALARNRLVFTGLLPLAGLAWFTAPLLHMVAAGHEVVLDAQRDALTLNGSRLAPLSDVAFFTGREQRGSRGAASFHLEAVLHGGRTLQLGGPDDRPDLVAAGSELNAALHRLRGDAAAVPSPGLQPGLPTVADCLGRGCPGVEPENLAALRGRIGTVPGATPP